MIAKISTIGSSPITNPDMRPWAVNVLISFFILMRSLIVFEMVSRISDRLLPTCAGGHYS